MSCAAITKLFSEAIATAIPESNLSLSQWAEAYRYLSPERSARAGKWHNATVPHLRCPMDLITRRDVRRFVMVKSSQIAGTELANNTVGFFMHNEPAAILYVAEDEKKARAWSTECLDPMLRDTPVLKGLVGEHRTRDSGNNIEGKKFSGGHLAIAWATSPATLSSRPRRVVILDERDAMLPTGEGDPVTLAEARQKTYEETRKEIIISSPRNRLPPPPGSPADAPHLSPVERDYEACAYRGLCYVPCPHCDEFQVLTWKNQEGDFNLRRDESDAAKAYYVCVKGCVIEQHEKDDMLARCEWRFTDHTGRVYTEQELKHVRAESVGVRIWEAYSPFVKWGTLLNNFFRKKDDPEALKSFVNTSLAEGWEDLTQLASVNDLVARREDYEAEVPDGVLIITASADTQGDRLETEIVGWGLDGESWSLDYQVLEGDPAQAEVWGGLKELWLTPLYRADGTQMRIRAAAVDTGGHHTQHVYRFCRENAGRNWYAVKGSQTPGQPLAPRKPTLKGRPPVRLYLIGTETAKDTFANNLAVMDEGPGFCHFPVQRGEEYFKQLRSERPMQRGNARVWEKIKKSARNEALDLRVYAMAALAILNPNWRALQARRLAVGKQAAAKPEADVQASAPTSPKPSSSFVGGGTRRGGRGSGWL